LEASCDGRQLYILWPFGIFYGNWKYFFPVLVFCTKKNLAAVAAIIKSQLSYRRLLPLFMFQTQLFPRKKLFEKLG
jgi:hypothetical protein